MIDETKLLLRLKEGHRNSINLAIEIYTPYLSTVLYNLAGTSLSYEDTEEIIADVFVMLWKNAGYIDLGKGTVRSYISATAKNLALKRLKKRRNIISIDDIDARNLSYDADNTVDVELWDYVMELGEPDNEIFVRYYRYGEKLKDISKAMGVNLSTVKTKLSRGKQKLKNILEGAEEML